MSSTKKLLAVAVGIVALSTTACATKKYVRAEVEAASEQLSERSDSIQTQVEENQTRLVEHDEQIGEVSATAAEALERAIEAGKLAEGKLLYETILSDDAVQFASDKAEISAAGASALDEFAARVISEGGDVYIEIQGHTDATGSEPYNLQLGERRAESVRRYLSGSSGLPLHRMSVISYGEAAPIADNSTREGRAQNRRVSLVVLK